MRILELDKIKENLIKSGAFELKKDWKNCLIFSGVNNPYEVTINVYGDTKDCFDVTVDSAGKIDIKSNIRLSIDNNVSEFTIGTTSFGDISVEECNNLIENYNLAIEITNKLNTIFFEVGYGVLDTDKIVVKDSDVKKVFDFCIKRITELEKDYELALVDIKEIMEDEQNKRAFITSGYEEGDTYVGFTIDTLNDTIIRYL